MSSESPAIDQLVDLAASARAMWSTDAAPSASSQIAATPRPPTAHRAITVHMHSDWRVTLRRVACVIGVGMIAVAIGLALRGDAPSVEGTAAAAVPAPSVAPLSRITVTPIEEPTVAPTAPIEMPIETPIETPSVAEPTAAPDPAPEVHRAQQHRHAKSRKLASARRAKVDVSNCVDSALGCLKVETPAAAVLKGQSKKPATSAKKAKKRSHGMSSADEDWDDDEE